MALNNKEFDENAGIDYYEFLKTVKDNKELYKYFESEDEIRKRAKAIKENSLKYGFTCLDNKGEIIPNYKVFQINNELIINESEDEK